MSQAILNLIISHLLTFVESELIKNEPKIVGAITQDVQSLIARLETLIADKSKTYAVRNSPGLTGISNPFNPGVADLNSPAKS
jgi:hypothetical protein